MVLLEQYEDGDDEFGRAADMAIRVGQQPTDDKPRAFAKEQPNYNNIF